jgi:hypothetical protein
MRTVHCIFKLHYVTPRQDIYRSRDEGPTGRVYDNVLLGQGYPTLHHAVTDGCRAKVEESEQPDRNPAPVPFLHIKNFIRVHPRMNPGLLEEKLDSNRLN